MFKAGWLVVCRVLTGAALPKANSVGATSGYTLADHAITTGSLLLVTVTHSEAWTDWTNHNAAVVSISATRFAKSSFRPRQSTWLECSER